MNTLYVAGGCFWGLEELFRSQPGVIATEAGYAGGNNPSPTYYYHPGHAETLEITYDATQTDMLHLLDFFFRVHDPTTRNRQGNDAGSSYRSAIFYLNQEQKRIVQEFIRTVNARGDWGKPVVTTLEKFETFWPAESFHQDYLQNNPGGYTCHYIRPIESFLK